MPVQWNTWLPHLESQLISMCWKERQYKDRLFSSVYFYLQQPECVGDKVCIVPHCCCSLERCIDFVSCICFVEKSPSSCALFVLSKQRQGWFLPGHLHVVSGVIVQLVLTRWIHSVTDSTEVCEFAWMLTAALYLPCIRMRVIDKRTVFLSCKSCECSQTPCGHGWRKKTRTTRSALADEYTDEQERGARGAKWESQAETEETLWERKKG